MAVNVNPTIQIILSGNQITNSNQTYSWTFENKIEETVNLTNVSSPYTLDYANVKVGKVLIISGTGVFNIVLTSGTNVITLINDGTIPTIIPVTAAFLTGLTSITFTTASTTAIQVFANVYGGVAV